MEKENYGSQEETKVIKSEDESWLFKYKETYETHNGSANWTSD
jgi:hypothetical protein